MAEKAKEYIQPHVKELIKCVTHLEPGSDSFSHLEHYVCANIWSDKFVTVDRYAIKKSYDGIIKKFIIHGYSTEAEKLQNLLDTFLSRKHWESKQHDIQWYVLSLLLHLSYHPTGSAPTEPDVVKPIPEEKTEEFDWPAYLLEDQPDFISLSGGSETEDECLSFDELQGECSSLTEDLTRSENEPKTKTDDECCSPLANGNEVSRDQIWAHIENTTLSAQRWLKKNVRLPFVQGYKVQSKFASANQAEFCEAFVTGNTENKQPTVLMSEYNVLREVLSALQVPPEPQLCLQKDWEGLFLTDQRFCYRPRETVTIPSLTKGSLQSQLSWLGHYMSLVREIEGFVLEISSSKENDGDCGNTMSYSGQEQKECLLPPSTYEAYASALREFLVTFKEKILVIEEKVKCQDGVCTLLSITDELRPAFKELTLVHRIHQRAVCCWKKNSNWFCACRLLTVLYGVLLSSFTDVGISVCLEIFMKTFQPYLEIIHTWLTEGRLEDWREEFIISRNTLVTGNTENFWKEGFILRPYEEELLKDGALEKGLSSSPPFGLLYLIEKKVLLLGKNMELLQRLEHLSEVHILPSFKRTLYNELVSVLESELGQYTSSSVKKEKGVASLPELTEVSDSCVQSSLRESLANGLQATKDIYLKEAFRGIVNVPISEGSSRATASSKSKKKRTTVPAMLPMKFVIEQQLTKLLEKRHGMSSTIVRTLLLGEFSLTNHLIIVRRIFLMEAGDLMHHFCTHLFQQAEMGERWVDPMSITSHLQECVSARYPDAAINFSVSVSPSLEQSAPPHSSNFNSTTTSSSNGETMLDQVSHIFINYTVQWPVNIVLNTTSMESYNTVFQFLLKVKWALWSLQQLRFCDLKVNRTSANPEDGTEGDEVDSMPLAVKVHRLQLLRAWLLHFVGSVHAYLMGQVLHVLGTKLESDLESVLDLDSIILVHEKYLEAMYRQCLQTKNAEFIKIAILRVLDISMTLCSLWRQPNLITSLRLYDMESQYIRHHVFLARVLESAMNRGFVDHLKALISPLVHSFPSH